MSAYPALDVRSLSTDLMLAIVDDFRPTAVEERDGSSRVFFASVAARDSALAALIEANGSVTPLDVDDEDWARRSQENLQAVTVGRITVAPPPALPEGGPAQPLTIVIAPSMGFGTGHHATTRLCLEALQTLDLTDKVVLDVGTGSGVLAIAALGLGAAWVVGYDNDPDAIHSARENLALNHPLGGPDRGVELRVADLDADALPRADVVTANLTGALLVRAASVLLSAVRPGGTPGETACGTLIVSGLLATERGAVVEAFAAAAVAWEKAEDEWVGLAFSVPGRR